MLTKSRTSFQKTPFSKTLLWFRKPYLVVNLYSEIGDHDHWLGDAMIASDADAQESADYNFLSKGQKFFNYNLGWK